MDLWQDFQYTWTNSLDERVVDLPLVASSYHVPIIMLTYVYLVFFYGPKFMKNRPAYSLKTFMQVYNIIQIVTNAWLIYDFFDAGLFTRSQLFLCPVLDYSYNETPMRLLRCGWIYMMLKILDYVETMVFILRKKDNQVSILHLYHHISTLLLAWLIMRYLATGPALFLTMMNTVIHVLMYTYYFLAACGPEIQQSKFIKNGKHILTLMQMIQFILMLLYLLQNSVPECKIVPYKVMIIVGANVLINLYLFYNFYQKAYAQKKSTNKKAQ